MLPIGWLDQGRSLDRIAPTRASSKMSAIISEAFLDITMLKGYMSEQCNIAVGTMGGKLTALEQNCTV